MFNGKNRINRSISEPFVKKRLVQYLYKNRMDRAEFLKKVDAKRSKAKSFLGKMRLEEMMYYI